MHAASQPVACFLKLQPWFGRLAPPWQEKLAATCYTLAGARGDVLLPARESSEGWYAVIAGFAKLQCPPEDPHAPGMAYLALPGGEWFGEGSVLQDEPRRYEVVALRETRLLCVPRGVFHELMSVSLPFCHAVLQHMNQRLGQAMAIIEANRTGSLEQRLALYLSRGFWHGLRKLNLSQEELGCQIGRAHV